PRLAHPQGSPTRLMWAGFDLFQPDRLIGNRARRAVGMSVRCNASVRTQGDEAGRDGAEVADWSAQRMAAACVGADRRQVSEDSLQVWVGEIDVGNQGSSALNHAQPAVVRGASVADEMNTRAEGPHLLAPIKNPAFMDPGTKEVER